MRCSDTAVFASSGRPLAHALAWPFVVAKATTQVCRRRNRNQPGNGLRATALARSDHPAAAGKSAPSAALPPTSPPAIVWCGDTPVLQSPGDRHEQHKRKPHLASSWIYGKLVTDVRLNGKIIVFRSRVARVAGPNAVSIHEE